MSRYFKTPLLGNEDAGPGHRVATFACPSGSPRPLPGQFFMVGLPGGHDPLLKRPFSLFRMTEQGHAQILYRIRGKGTRLLADLAIGTEIELLGPLGTSFPKPGGRQPVLVGGGLGMVPLAELSISLKNEKPRIFLGARNTSELLAESLFRGIDPDLSLSTDDGSAGARGLVTDRVSEYLQGLGESERTRIVVYACGPVPMLKALSALCKGNGISGFVSLEEHMACGVGACMGCVTRTDAGYKRVCREGPVFPMHDVLKDIPVVG